MAPLKKKLKTTSFQSSKTFAFSSEQDEMLIELVAQNPTLYDLNLDSYKNGLTKGNIWKDIGTALNKTSIDCKKRWKYIKDSYNRYKRKKKAGTGNAALPKTSKWEFYERLKFLEFESSAEELSNISCLLQECKNEFLDTVQNKDNNSDDNGNSVDDDDDDDDDDGDDDSQSTESSIVNEPKGARNSLKENSNFTEMTSKQNKNNLAKIQKQNTNNTKKAVLKTKRKNKQDEVIQYMKEKDIKRQDSLKQIYEENTGKYMDDDDINSFGAHIKTILRKLPPILKVKAKAEIFNIMSKYELMSMETQDSNPTSSGSNNLM